MMSGVSHRTKLTAMGGQQYCFPSSAIKYTHTHIIAEAEAGKAGLHAGVCATCGPLVLTHTHMDVSVQLRVCSIARTAWTRGSQQWCIDAAQCSPSDRFVLSSLRIQEKFTHAPVLSLCATWRMLLSTRRLSRTRLVSVFESCMSCLSASQSGCHSARRGAPGGPGAHSTRDS